MKRRSRGEPRPMQERRSSGHAGIWVRTIVVAAAMLGQAAATLPAYAREGV